MKVQSKPKALKIGKSEKGVMLIEALVALLIFSFGILAIVGLQTAAVRNTSDSQYRVEASLLAQSLIGLMRAADQTSVATDYATSGTAYNAWKSRVQDAATGLPGASANAPTVVFNGRQVTVSVFWRAPTDTATRQYVTSTQLD